MDSWDLQAAGTRFRDPVCGRPGFKPLHVLIMRFAIYSSMLLASCLIQSSWTKNEGDKCEKDKEPRIHAIKRWKSPTPSHLHSSFAESIAIERMPVVMTNTVVIKWKAMSWGLNSNLSSILDEKLLFKEQFKDRIFTLRASPNEDGVRLRTKEKNSIGSLNLTVADALEAFSKAHSRNSGNPKEASSRYLYHSGPSDRLASHIDPTRLLLPSTDRNPKPNPNLAERPFEFQDDLNEYSNLSSHALWLGQKGVVAQYHHDKSHNFHAQLVGRNTFAPRIYFTQTLTLTRTRIGGSAGVSIPRTRAPISSHSLPSIHLEGTYFEIILKS